MARSPVLIQGDGATNGKPETRFNEIKQDIQKTASRCDLLKGQLEYLKVLFTGGRSVQKYQQEENHATEVFNNGEDKTEETGHTASNLLSNEESCGICLPNVPSSVHLISKKIANMDYSDVLISNSSTSLDFSDDTKNDEKDKHSTNFPPDYQICKSALENLESNLLRPKKEKNTSKPMQIIRHSKPIRILLDKKTKTKDENADFKNKMVKVVKTINEENHHFKNNKSKQKLNNTDSLSNNSNKNNRISTISHKISAEKQSQIHINKENSNNRIFKTYTEGDGKLGENMQNILERKNERINSDQTLDSIKENVRRDLAKIPKAQNMKISFRTNENKGGGKEHKHKMIRVRECRRKPMDTASINSTTTIPTSNAKSEDEEHLSNNICTTKKPKGILHKNNTKIFKLELREMRRYKTKLKENEVFNSDMLYKCKFNTHSQEKKETHNREFISYNNSKKKNKSDESSTGKVNTETFSCGNNIDIKQQTCDSIGNKMSMHITPYLVNSMQSTLLSISEGSVNESSGILNNGTKKLTKEKYNSMENSKVNGDQKDIVKFKIARRGYELHTVSSRLKMAERSCFPQFNFRTLPFVVGKATTPSHNLALNIQQSLSIIKMKQPAFNAFPLSSDPTVNLKCISASNIGVCNTDKNITDQVAKVHSGNSLSGVMPCPMLNRNSSMHCGKLSSDIDGEISQESPSYVNNERDAINNRCTCYPRNSINYHKILNQYLDGGEQLSYLGQSYGSPDKYSKQLSINITSRNSTMSVRLAKILRQVQMFQEILKG